MGARDDKQGRAGGSRPARPAASPGHPAAVSQHPGQWTATLPTSGSRRRGPPDGTAVRTQGVTRRLRYTLEQSVKEEEHKQVAPEQPTSITAVGFGKQGQKWAAVVDAARLACREEGRNRRVRLYTGTVEGGQ
jgi:hypothetical protein